jgi:hypothetical protein
LGLDQNLEKEIYIGGYYEHNNVSGIVDIISSEKRHIIDPKTISSIQIHVAYWRKSNQIHKWIVEKSNDGIYPENDTRVIIAGEQLLELVDLCKELLKDRDIDKAEELLPPSEGFFFGSYDIDEYYWQDLEYTIEQLKDVNKEEYYIYTASY